MANLILLVLIIVISLMRLKTQIVDGGGYRPVAMTVFCVIVVMLLFLFNS